MIPEGKPYTIGKSFRAMAEAHARGYRKDILKVYPGEHAHWLPSDEANAGKNFVESMRREIFDGVAKRKQAGKGIDFKRTTTNLLSSQAMCFNLFVPLKKWPNLLVHVLQKLIPGLHQIESLDLEYTPPKEIFHDQIGLSGVDCDVLVRGIKANGEKVVVVIETKYVETEFSICGFRKRKSITPCSADTIVGTDFSNCNYKTKKGYKYWDVSASGDLIKQSFINFEACPFGDGKWQLWTNFCLAFGIAQYFEADEFHSLVVFPSQNLALSRCNEVFDQFRNVITKPDRFHPLRLEDVVGAIKEKASGGIENVWIDQFAEKYLF